jgi:hypothetical protein
MTSKARRLADGVFLSAHSGGSKRFMAPQYYIYDRAAHVSEVDRLKWTRWVEKRNSASIHNWVGMAQVVTTFPGASERDFSGMAQLVTATLGAGRYVWDLGLWLGFVMNLDGDDLEEPQLCKGGFEQGEAMHARALAIARRRRSGEEQYERGDGDDGSRARWGHRSDRFYALHPSFASCRFLEKLQTRVVAIQQQCAAFFKSLRLE